MELSIRSLKTPIPFDIKDINAILLVITADPRLHALDIIAVEGELTLPTIGHIVQPTPKLLGLILPDR